MKWSFRKATVALVITFYCIK